MNRKMMAISVAVLISGITLGYMMAQFTHSGDVPEGLPTAEREVLYWKAPMDSDFRSDQPGKSPMGMDLVPVYAGDDAGGENENTLRINPAVVNNIGVRTARVTRDTLYREIETVGFIAPDDDLTSHVHVRVEGWIERLLVKSEGSYVRKGDLIFEMYSPALVNAEAEYLQALRINQGKLASAAGERLLALGMTADQIETLRKSGKVDHLVEIRAPQDGYVTALNVGEGMFIKPSITAFVLADLSSIWVMVDIFEGQAGWVEEGQSARMTLTFLPGREWDGVVDYVYPTVQAESRTVQVRLRFANADGVLKPNMYAEIGVSAAPRMGILNIPKEALIRTGRDDRVILALEDGRFQPAKVVAGIESGERIEILSGLQDGETIVTSGQFLLDSEASLAGTFLRMSAETHEQMDMNMDMPESMDITEMDHSKMETPATAIAPEITGTGTVNSIMAGHGMINLSHGPIDTINWPEMTMDFIARPDVDLGKIGAGDHVSFTLEADGNGSYVITAIGRVQH